MTGAHRIDPIHFIGIAGTGMSGLAHLAHGRGMQVQGTDTAAGAKTRPLEDQGIQVFAEHKAEHLEPVRSVVYSSAVAEDNPERAEADRRSLTVFHRSEFLAWLMDGHTRVSVAGTHGKTTTSALLTHVLTDLGQDPSAAIGGSMRREGASARLGQGTVFVAEADESDGTFLRYKPHFGLLTNVEADHMEFFGNETKLVDTFRAYLKTIEPEGWALVGWDHPLCRNLGEGYTGNMLSYGFALGSEIRCYDWKAQGGETVFRAVVEKDRIEARLPIPGLHNVQNALGVLATVRAMGLSVSDAAESLAGYQGVKRRFETYATPSGRIVVDDYAHNPGKIAASIASVRHAWPERTLTVVFEPHRYSRVASLYDEMLGALSNADAAVVLPVYAAGESPDPQINQEDIARDLRERYGIAGSAADFDTVCSAVKSFSKDSSVILVVGAGRADEAAQLLKEEFS